MNKEILIKPQDLLFFRDAKPMAAGEGYGNGCNMPNPNILHSAIRTALIKENGELPKEKKGNRHSKDKNKKYGSDKFGSLQVKNLFPYHSEKGILFPIPNDVMKAEQNVLKITELKRIENKVLPVATIPPSKKRVEGFWTEQQLFAYLNNEITDFTPFTQSKVWQSEHRVGIEIEPNSNSTKEGGLYAGEYMRLDDKAGFVAEVSLKDDEGDLSKINTIHFGGEKKIANIANKTNLFPEWDSAEYAEENIVKWILLTPAIFANGALPGWIENNKVLLQPKINGQKTAINADLLCCSVGNPIPISGWDSIENKAKPTLLAVSAGAVYYFKCTTAKDAKNLTLALNAKNRSDMLSEQGFGFGLTTITNNKI